MKRPDRYGNVNVCRFEDEDPIPRAASHHHFGGNHGGASSEVLNPQDSTAKSNQAIKNEYAPSADNPILERGRDDWDRPRRVPSPNPKALILHSAIRNRLRLRLPSVSVCIRLPKSIDSGNCDREEQDGEIEEELTAGSQSRDQPREGGGQNCKKAGLQERIQQQIE
ncbi:MAG TPA: hypothetical protein VKT81_13755 [Bryobacteraceae bacterium]|nr:hypothetical protein [Bryobacteraceae bacterium]